MVVPPIKETPLLPHHTFLVLLEPLVRTQPSSSIQETGAEESGLDTADLYPEGLKLETQAFGQTGDGPLRAVVESCARAAAPGAHGAEGGDGP